MLRGFLVFFAWSGWALAASIGPADSAESWRALHEPRFETVDAQRDVLDGPTRAITEDADGVIWTVAGSHLWRWDGYQLVRARLQAAAGASTEETPVLQTVATDAAGGLWAGAAKGLFRVDRRWPSRPALEPVPLGGDLPSIRFIQFPPLMTSTGVSAYFGTVDRVLLWGGEGNVRSHLIPDAGPNRLHALHLGSDGRLWAGTTFGLFELVEDSGAPHWVEKPLPVARARIAAITTDGRGRLWVGTASEGLFSIGPNGETKAWPWPASVPGGGPPRVFSLLEADKGQIWVGQFGRGVLALDTDRRQWRTMRHDRSRAGSLADDNVWSLFRDSRGLAWVGTSNGLQFSRPTQRRLLYVPLPSNADEPLARTRVHGLWPTGDGVWGGSEAGQPAFLGPGAPDSEQSALPALWAQGPAPGGKMELIAAMGAGHWVLGSDDRTEHVQPSRGLSQPLQPAARGSAKYTSAAVVWKGAWWLSGPDGLWRLPLDAAGQPRLDAAVNLLADTDGERRVSSLLSTPDTLWVGTWSGLSRLDSPEGPVAHVDVPGLDAHFITTIELGRHGRLWLGTSAGGIYVAPMATVNDPASWSVIDESTGLPGNSIGAIVVDHGGLVWASTSRGLARIEPRTLALRPYRADQGAAAAPYARRSGAVLPGGELVFGGNDALTVVLPDPEGLDAPPALPRLILSDISAIEGEPEVLFDPALTEESSPRLRVPYGVSRFGIEVAAPLYQGAKALRYRHRLVGWDDRWVVTDAAHRMATFTRLTPGNYRFEAQVAEAAGEWTTPPLVVDVSVIPAWHQHRGFHLALVLAVLTIVIVAVRGRQRLLRARAENLERMVETRTAALAAANEELAEAHRAVEAASLTDPLTGLHNRRFLWRHIDADVAMVLRKRFDREVDAPVPTTTDDLIFFLIDIDHFKRINDQHGHAVGDQVLVEVGRRLRIVFRESDHVVRWGGEEFLGVTRGAQREDGPRIAERIRATIVATPFELGHGRSLNVSCSIGFAALPLVAAQHHAFGWEDTVAVADEALYEAKASGRDAWAGYEESGADIDPERLSALRARTIAASDVEGLNLRSSTAP